MPRNDQITRQWHLLRQLESSQGRTLQELVDNVPDDYPKNARTVRRDLEALAAGGFPVITERHNGHTVPRMTRDIDIVVELAAGDLGRFIALFQTDFYLDAETVRAAIETKGMFNLIQNHYIVKIAFIVRKDSPYRRREFSRRKKITVDDRSLHLAAPEDLILSKLEWAKDSRSEMQLSDVRNLLKSVKRLNRRYLASGAKELSVEMLYREVSR